MTTPFTSMLHTPPAALLRSLVLALLAAAVTGSPAAAATADRSGQPFPFKLTDCNGLWFKMYAPRERLQAAVPDRYEVYSGNTSDGPTDEVTNLAFGNLYVQTDRCADDQGRPVTISRVSAQVRQPAFDPGRFPVRHPDADKPLGDWWEYYYLLAVVLPEGDEATRDLRDYLAARGLPVATGTVDAVLAEMGAAPTGHVTPRTTIDVPGVIGYRVEGVSASATFQEMHEHVTSYYHDSRRPGGDVRTTRMIIDSVTVDWLASCNTTASTAPMTEWLGAPRNATGWCFYMDGPHTWIGASTLDTTG